MRQQNHHKYHYLSLLRNTLLTLQVPQEQIVENLVLQLEQVSLHLNPRENVSNAVSYHLTRYN